MFVKVGKKTNHIGNDFLVLTYFALLSNPSFVRSLTAFAPIWNVKFNWKIQDAGNLTQMYGKMITYQKKKNDVCKYLIRFIFIESSKNKIYRIHLSGWTTNPLMQIPYTLLDSSSKTGNVNDKGQGEIKAYQFSNVENHDFLLNGRWCFSFCKSILIL